MMTREEVIRLAKLAATKVVDYDLIGNPITDADVVMLGAYGPFIERFAELVAAEYKRDALRYRMLRSNERFVVDEKCADGNWEPIHYDDLDRAVDEEMEKVK